MNRIAVSRYTKAGFETHHRPAGLKAERAMEAMPRMKKINIAELERAVAEEPVGRMHHA